MLYRVNKLDGNWVDVIYSDADDQFYQAGEEIGPIHVNQCGPDYYYCHIKPVEATEEYLLWLSCDMETELDDEFIWEEGSLKQYIGGEE